jgi:hypothetical protein
LLPVATVVVVPMINIITFGPVPVAVVDRSLLTLQRAIP